MKRKAKVPPVSQEQLANLVADYVKRRDLQWWLSGVTAPSAFSEVRKEIGHHVSLRQFRDSVAAHCEWYGKQKRLPPLALKDSALTTRGWDRLRGVVLSRKAELMHVGIEAAVAIVSAEVRCNSMVLRGLATHLHFWERDELLAGTEKTHE